MITSKKSSKYCMHFHMFSTFHVIAKHYIQLLNINNNIQAIRTLLSFFFLHFQSHKDSILKEIKSRKSNSQAGGSRLY